jgi:YidC/Oxa1 family membrane protein insertase
MIGLLSILTPIEDVLTGALDWLHTTLGLTWAWSIVALTITVRMLLVPLTVRQIHSMQRMQQHLPEMKAIQKRFKNDRRKQNEELMKFYKENQINPASSCLPIIPQIPIFFALYFVLRDFDDEIYPLYPESSLSWLGFVPDITANITADWSGYVLLAVYVASQVASTWFMPTQSKGQRVIFLILPFVFVFFIIDPPGGTVFPVGLLIYWMTTNLWTVGQGIATRGLRQRAMPEPVKRSSRTPPKSEQEDGATPAEPEAAAQAQKPQGQARRVKRKKKRKGARR